MEITEIRVRLTGDPRNKLKAYCSITFDDAFVVRDLKIIEGTRGPFVAMPSRKLSDHCVHCSAKNHMRAAYCNACGGRLNPDRAQRDSRGRARLHADLAHPINSPMRIRLHRAVVSAFADEVERSQTEGYKPTSFDDLDDLSEFLDEEYLDDLARRQEERERRRRDEGAAEQGAGS